MHAPTVFLHEHDYLTMHAAKLVHSCTAVASLLLTKQQKAHVKVIQQPWTAVFHLM